MSLQQSILNDIDKTAQAVRASGGRVDINYGLPSIAITNPDGSEYFFQEHEASEILDSIPDEVFEVDYIMWSAQSW